VLVQHLPAKLYYAKFLVGKLLQHQLRYLGDWQTNILLNVIQFQDSLLLEAEDQVLEDLLVTDQLLCNTQFPMTHSTLQCHMPHFCQS